MHKIDWMGKSHKFAAIDLDKVCRVPAGLGDELVMRAEMQELKLKFQDLASAFDEVKQLTISVSKSADDVVSAIGTVNQLSPPLPNPQTQSKTPPLDLNLTQKTAREPDGSSRPETPLYSQIMAMKYNKPDSKEIAHGGNAGWKMISRKKKPKIEKKQMGIVGQLKSTCIQSAEPYQRPRKAILFVTRCKPETTENDLEKDILDNISFYQLDQVESIATKFETYKSFKVSFLLDDKSLSQFFIDTMKPEVWGDGVLVKPFSMRRKSAAPFKKL